VTVPLCRFVSAASRSGSPREIHREIEERVADFRRERCDRRNQGIAGASEGEALRMGGREGVETSGERWAGYAVLGDYGGDVAVGGYVEGDVGGADVWCCAHAC
jgi:hypothetical protein